MEDNGEAATDKLAKMSAFGSRVFMSSRALTTCCRVLLLVVFSLLLGLAQLGVGENFGVGGAFAKWGAARGSANQTGPMSCEGRPQAREASAEGYTDCLVFQVPVTPRNFVRLLQRNEAGSRGAWMNA